MLRRQSEANRGREKAEKNPGAMNTMKKLFFLSLLLEDYLFA